jgi:hypothetical protein
MWSTRGWVGGREGGQGELYYPIYLRHFCPSGEEMKGETSEEKDKDNQKDNPTPPLGPDKNTLLRTMATPRCKPAS